MKNLIITPKWKRVYIPVPFIRELTARVPIKLYFDFDRQKFISDKLQTLVTYSLGSGSDSYSADENHRWYHDAYEHRKNIEKWFTPKDNDWDEEIKKEIEKSVPKVTPVVIKKPIVQPKTQLFVQLNMKLPVQPTEVKPKEPIKEFTHHPNDDWSVSWLRDEVWKTWSR